MEVESITEKLNVLFQSVFKVDFSDLDETASLKELDYWDSLAHMMFITGFEREFDTELSGDEIATLTSVKQIKNLLRKNGINIE